MILEPKNKHDSNAIAMMSPRGVQLGYINAERAPYSGGRMVRGEDDEAIFQRLAGGSAFIHVGLGGGAPTSPPSSDKYGQPSAVIGLVGSLLALKLPTRQIALVAA